MGWREFLIPSKFNFQLRIDDPSSKSLLCLSKTQLVRVQAWSLLVISCKWEPIINPRFCRRRDVPYQFSNIFSAEGDLMEKKARSRRKEEKLKSFIITPSFRLRELWFTMNHKKAGFSFREFLGEYTKVFCSLLNSYGKRWLKLFQYIPHFGPLQN